MKQHSRIKNCCHRILSGVEWSEVEWSGLAVIADYRNGVNNVYIFNTQYAHIVDDIHVLFTIIHCRCGTGQQKINYEGNWLKFIIFDDICAARLKWNKKKRKDKKSRKNQYHLGTLQRGTKYQALSVWASASNSKMNSSLSFRSQLQHCVEECVTCENQIYYSVQLSR